MAESNLAPLNPPPSRLPNVGTTIFTVMSALAAEKNAVNLGQGFPDFDCDPRIVDAVTHAMRTGHNQYPPMAGVPQLRQAIAAKIAKLYEHTYDWNTEITVTAGATQGLLTAILCAVHPGDEVIVLEPCYDSYLPAIELAGATAVPVTLEAPLFRIPFDKLAAAITPRTRMIMINTPHNPTGTIWREEDMQQLADLLAGTDILLLSDEVYEHMVYDGQQHESVARHPELARRSFVVSSFGKTYHVTGWKVGFVAAPAALSNEFRKVHQFNVFTVNTPVQYGLADYMADPAPYLNLSAFYQAKRDYFRAGLAGTRFKLLPSDGTYFQCVDYSAISDMSEADFSMWLTREIGVAAIPVSAFYSTPRESGVVRFCFAKKEETLKLALDRLAKL
ncbi:methionine transaminase [Cupriavidus metallidurans]|jgi:methionine aminotransferase|uniref:Methionine aminotransferase, PLP-dependent n=1 Tax=Cupriavidus metallidurans (strain ATCC 43123 / DSM 2839 / NBRC 102507 / CH34) TaxID=266264 RepID=Q1LPR4_CUPMC|nr:pyridoxal phosphate-dependent aminotransferase [Cupriavidus metallidurans]ABF07862.1 Methionine aminotransferase, PLP-dependent [Cupriavidus metallidurans CH34]AVA33151.1 pyridoxal phosphate-dependent aminotransferase [Cupriavidus metallidurans]MDE4917349.1 pyridoxal phosphate-dependent aminotransferase [Cupriavidus metallidurans]QGS27846.1 aminotransferase class I/II-fold pyridoxal phosphate-dependent enzyme [Cupriavidus metallidurans]UBM12003.1 pyridoxal phosphate-dependent aminotransfera